MPSNIYSPRYRRLFIQQQTGGLRAVNNTAGVWTSTGAKLLRVPENSFVATPGLPKTRIPWLTGTRSDQPAILGRKSATFALNNLMVIPSGTAGTIPDSDVLWQAVFGQAATIVATTSCTYSFLDSGYLPFTLLDFAHSVPTLTSRTIWGCMPTEVTFTLNGNIFEASVQGSGGYVLDSDYFATEPDVTAKAGLTAYPLEPSSPVTIGNVIAGFGATALIDGQSLETKIQSMTIRIQTGFRLVGDVLADGYASFIGGGPRACSMTLGLIDDDSAGTIDLKQKAKSNATISATITVGTVGGAKVQFQGVNLQLVPYSFNDQTDIVQTNFPESMFHASTIGTTDDLSLAFL